MGRRHAQVLVVIGSLLVFAGCSSPDSSPMDVKAPTELVGGEVHFVDVGGDDPRCYPECDGRQCGGDGCEGSCGMCEGPLDLCLEGQCLCQPACDGMACGDDGCGDICGDCDLGFDCQEGICVPEGCEPDCQGNDCGDDGCGDSCGSCDDGWQCDDGLCEEIPCIPVCGGLECGNDGCDGSCGDCQDSDECVDGLCVCLPDCEGVQCGSDGCGGSCGECAGEFESCLNGECVTAPALGASCSLVADCPNDSVCFLGMCTHKCMVEGEPDGSACEAVSPASPWGEVFGCAPDLELCMPGEVDGIDLLCKHDSDCLAGSVCSGAFPLAGSEASGACLPDIGLESPGAECLSNGDCATFLCLENQLGSGGGVCGNFCIDSTECAAGSLCVPNPVSEGGDVVANLPLCMPLAGSLATCTQNSHCKIGKEYCGAILSPSGGETTFACLESGNAQGLWPGNLCDTSADCFEPYCMFETWSANVDAYCTHPCQDASQCPDGMDCRKVDVDPTSGIWPGSDFSLHMCVKVAEDSPCFVGMDETCAYAWSKCKPIPGVGWIGTCESGLCPPSCDGKACLADNGCGKPCVETCLANGQQCNEGSQCLSGFCVDGVCCNSQCDDTCKSCVLPDAAGSCSAILAGMDPGQECGACHRCDGQGGCIQIPAGPEDSGLCAACHVCDGDGECVPGPALTDPLGDCDLCQLCDGEGGCSPVPSGSDPKEECEETAPETCSFKGSCDGNGECAKWPSMTLCGEHSCAGVKYSPAPHCDGDGKCLVQPFENCTPYQCDVASPACLTGCEEHAECVTGNWCNQGICEPMPSCPWAQKLICNAMIPADTSIVDNLWSDYTSCTPGVPYLGGEKLYQVKPTKPTRISVTVTNFEFDAAVVLLDGACNPAAACSQMVDYMPAGIAETFTFDAAADTQYYIVVDGLTEQDSGPLSIQADCCEINCAAENGCGDDGCGGTCGSCGGEALCVEGVCEACAAEGAGEPNDICESALPVDEGDWESLLCPSGDMDWYSFEAGKGDAITLLLDFDPTAVDFDLALYGSDCGEALVESMNPDEMESLFYLIPEAGQYFIKVSSPGGNQGAYTLSVLMQEPECSSDTDCPAGQVCGLFECTVPPAPCPAAGKLLCGQQVEGDSTGGESGLEDYTSCSDLEFAGPETIYTMSVQEPTTATLTLAGLPEGGAIAVLEQFCATEWACQKLDVGDPGIAAQVVMKMVPGVAYYVLVEGLTESDAGAFILNADCCVPQCDGVECGSDGCGTDCGPCAGAEDVCEGGVCVCQPNCNGLECGDDGCGGSCGDCEAPLYLCAEGICVCQPNCDGLECGDDGCGGSCGECEGELIGCVEGSCKCLPQCEGKECGDDGCGGKCGVCEGQDLCVDTICLCQPSCQGKICGDDGCGGSCGGCEGEQDVCMNGFCVCQPACEPLACGDDGCGGSCASCPPGRVCDAPACVCQAEAGEPNGSCGEATGLPPGLYEDFAICPAGDEDYYSFQLTAGQKLTVTIFFEHDDGDLELFIYKKSSCSSYLKSSTSGTDNESIAFVAPASGTYAVRILEFGKLAENAYTLEATIE
jgi:hypothetical protein